MIVESKALVILSLSLSFLLCVFFSIYLAFTYRFLPLSLSLFLSLWLTIRQYRGYSGIPARMDQKNRKTKKKRGHCFFSSLFSLLSLSLFSLFSTPPPFKNRQTPPAHPSSASAASRQRASSMQSCASPSTMTSCRLRQAFSLSVFAFSLSVLSAEIPSHSADSRQARSSTMASSLPPSTNAGQGAADEREEEGDDDEEEDGFEIRAGSGTCFGSSLTSSTGVSPSFSRSSLTNLSTSDSASSSEKNIRRHNAGSFAYALVMKPYVSLAETQLSFFWRSFKVSFSIQQFLLSPDLTPSLFKRKH